MVQEFVIALANDFRAKVLALPAKLRAVLPGKPDFETEDRLDAVIDEFLREIAENLFGRARAGAHEHLFDATRPAKKVQWCDEKIFRGDRMNVLDDPVYVAADRAFMAQLKRDWLAIVCAPIGHTLRARKVFRAIERSRKKWIDARLGPLGITPMTRYILFILSKGKIEHACAARQSPFFALIDRFICRTLIPKTLVFWCSAGIMSAPSRGANCRRMSLMKFRGRMPKR